jgi:alpha-amylase
MVKRGQIEIMSGGYYEPILPILKPSDAMGQIKMMQEFWKKHAGVTPKGMWLAERVWEPSLAGVLPDAGMQYTILDDEHFRHAGLTEPTLLNYYLTERAGKTLAIFPSDQRLRYMIPFRPVEEVIGHLISLGQAAPGVGITYGDDGEKFGVWPGTHEWVIQKGWLEQFFDQLTENKARIVTTTFSEFMARRCPTKIIYLPTASYQEMLEWAMPADAIFRFERAKKILKDSGVWELASSFLRGGFFDNFLSKYPESNNIHNKMLYVSDMIDAAEAECGEKLHEARAALYRGQCNCAYWHGLFGGLYLSHLRHALYENLIAAEVAVERRVHGTKPYVNLRTCDIDHDRIDEAMITTPDIGVTISPGAGGAITELSYRPARFNLQNTLARRFEAYHRPAEDNQDMSKGNNIPSIHEIGKDIRGMGQFLVYDRHPRYTFLDHILPENVNWADLVFNRHEEICDFGGKQYKMTSHQCRDNNAHISLECDACFAHGKNLKIKKEYRVVTPNAIETSFTLERLSGDFPSILFATEMNLTLLAGHDPSRYYQWGNIQRGKMFMDSRETITDAPELKMVDEAFGFRVSIKTEPQARWQFFPIETISQSEKGFDRLYQGSNIWMSWKPLWNKDNKAHFSVCISLESL